MFSNVHDVPIILGTENEYGIIGAQPIDITHAALKASGASIDGHDGVAVRWDYSSELPLRDARGFTLSRDQAHPSMLTDVEGMDTPAGPVPGRTDDEEQVSHHPEIHHELSVRLTHSEEQFQRGSASAMANGARLYVDHGHPEYATPECSSPAQAVLYDRVGDQLMGQALSYLAMVNGTADDEYDSVNTNAASSSPLSEARKDTGTTSAPHHASRKPTARLFKNNVDGKGASYGTHENYLVTRDVSFNHLAEALIPFFVTRPILVGAGRWGVGQISEHQSFQISQRADYIEQVMSLGTTVNRPIINTRDEPHTDPSNWRRLHVIVGDANAFDSITWLRLGMTALVLTVISTGKDKQFTSCALADPVDASHRVSHDLTIAQPLDLADGRTATAIDIQRHYLHAVAEAWGVELVSENPSSSGPHHVPTAIELPDLERFALGTTATWHEEAIALIHFWDQSLMALQERAYAIAQGAHSMSADLPGGHLEWVARAAIINGARSRRAASPSQADAVAGMVDLLWSELGKEQGLAAKTPQGQANHTLWSPHLLADAQARPPQTTRAFLRGYLIDHFRDNVVAAGWHSIILEVFDAHHWRLPLTDVQSYGRDRVAELLNPNSIQDTMEALTGVRPPDPGTVEPSLEGQEPDRELHPFSPSAIAHPPVHRSAGGGPIAPYDNEQ